MKAIIVKLTRTILPLLVGGIIGGLVTNKWFSDDRVIIEDQIVGADFRVTQVDGVPVDRQERSWIGTRVSHALVEPGQQTLTVIAADGSSGEKSYTLETQILNGLRYQMNKNGDGSPYLLVIGH